MRNTHTEKLRDINWLYEKLKVLLLEMNEKDWEDMSMHQYYDAAILGITDELKQDRKDETERANGSAF